MDATVKGAFSPVKNHVFAKFFHCALLHVHWWQRAKLLFKLGGKDQQHTCKDDSRGNPLARADDFAR